MSRKKQLQRMKPAEDERKLQTKLFVKLRVWRPKGRNHRFMMVDKSKAVSTERSGLFCFMLIFDYNVSFSSKNIAYRRC